jgi:hypothetical protein
MYLQLQLAFLKREVTGLEFRLRWGGILFVLEGYGSIDAAA